MSPLQPPSWPPTSFTPASDLIPSAPDLSASLASSVTSPESDSLRLQLSKRQTTNFTLDPLVTSLNGTAATSGLVTGLLNATAAALNGSVAVNTTALISPFVPTHTQYVTIYVIEFYVITLLLCWNLKYARTAIFSFKLLTVAFHESCHAIMGTITGAKVESIMLDPNQGGATRMVGGFSFVSVSGPTRFNRHVSSPLTNLLKQLPAGYIGSTTIGSALIFAGFDEYASKVAVFPILGLTCLIMWWARKDRFTITNLLVPWGLIVALYVIEHAAYLRFLILFIGVMNVMYACWDILDDLVFHKIEASDCAHFALDYPWMPAQVWGAVWFFFAFMALCAGVLGGLVVFKENFIEQQIAAQAFIPT